MAADYVSLSPGELERHQREAARKLRCERLRQVRRREDALGRAERRQLLGEQRRLERQHEAAELRARLEAKRAQLEGLMEERAACEAARGAAGRAAASRRRERSLEEERSAQLEAQRRLLEAQRGAEALRRNREPRMAQLRELCARRALQWRVRGSEDRRAHEAAESGRAAAAAGQAQAREEERKAVELCRRRPRRVPVADRDRRGGSDYAKTCYHTLHHGQGQGAPEVQAELDRPLSPQPAPTPSQLQRADARGRAAKAEVALARLDEDLERRMAAEEAQNRLAKVRRAASAGAPCRAGAPPWAHWTCEVPPRSAAAEAEAAALLASVSQAGPPPQAFDEWTLRSPRRRLSARATAPGSHGHWRPASASLPQRSARSAAEAHPAARPGAGRADRSSGSLTRRGRHRSSSPGQSWESDPDGMPSEVWLASATDSLAPGRSLSGSRTPPHGGCRAWEPLGPEPTEARGLAAPSTASVEPHRSPRPSEPPWPMQPLQEPQGPQAPRPLQPLQPCEPLPASGAGAWRHANLGDPLAPAAPDFGGRTGLLPPAAGDGAADGGAAVAGADGNGRSRGEQPGPCGTLGVGSSLLPGVDGPLPRADRMAGLLAEAEALLRETAAVAAPFIGSMAVSTDGGGSGAFHALDLRTEGGFGALPSMPWPAEAPGFPAAPADPAARAALPKQSGPARETAHGLADAGEQEGRSWARSCSPENGLARPSPSPEEPPTPPPASIAPAPVPAPLPEPEPASLEQHFGRRWRSSGQWGGGDLGARLEEICRELDAAVSACGSSGGLGPPVPSAPASR
mmetsp:Transcript_66682/g.214822  ORF Transcript_66682/g.214822 Transcript_66682/m.214822 type:complete len:801 (+) Transcript_66682:67-2469(+)